MAIVRVNGDPFAAAAFSVPPELGRAHWRTDQTSCAQHIGDRAGAIVAHVIKRVVAAAVAVRFRAKLISSPDRQLHGRRRLFRRSCLAGRVNPRFFVANNWARVRKVIADYRWNN